MHAETQWFHPVSEIMCLLAPSAASTPLAQERALLLSAHHTQKQNELLIKEITAQWMKSLLKPSSDTRWHLRIHIIHTHGDGRESREEACDWDCTYLWSAVVETVHWKSFMRSNGRQTESNRAGEIAGTLESWKKQGGAMKSQEYEAVHMQWAIYFSFWPASTGPRHSGVCLTTYSVSGDGNQHNKIIKFLAGNKLKIEV